MYDLTWHPDAREELEDELELSKNRWGAKHARQFGKDLRQKIRKLKNNPKIFQVHDDFGPNVRLLRFKGVDVPYIVIDRPKRVTVLAIQGSEKKEDVGPRIRFSIHDD